MIVLPLMELLIERDKFRQMTIQEISSFMDIVPNQEQAFHYNYKYGIYDRKISHDIKNNELRENYAALTLHNFDEQDDFEPYIELDVKMTMGARFIPLGFNVQTDPSEQPILRHIGALWFRHKAKILCVFDPDEYLTFYHWYTINTSLDGNAYEWCHDLLFAFARKIGYSLQQSAQSNCNFEIDDNPLMDGRNCALISIIYATYDIKRITPSQMCQLLTHFLRAYIKFKHLRNCRERNALIFEYLDKCFA